MSRTSREKGHAGERELAGIFREAGHVVHQLQRNRSDMADLLVDDWLFVDSKRAERWKLREWIAQVLDCTPIGATPAIAFRSNREPWGIWTPLEHYLPLLPPPEDHS